MSQMALVTHILWSYFRQQFIILQYNSFQYYNIINQVDCMLDTPLHHLSKDHL